MKGKYLGKADSSNLVPGMSYYLFENGKDYFYVSRFNNKKAHFGCYEKTPFEINEETREKSEVTFKVSSSGQISFF
ncbi:hypothetical protein MHH96_24205 [Niallia sp. FSL K6-0212]|uniref:hypothetical protein n=1 Tax=Niallia sp. FSL K6-0212 TaxID=2921423 RepID=UPI0030F97D6E